MSLWTLTKQESLRQEEERQGKKYSRVKELERLFFCYGSYRKERYAFFQDKGRDS